MFRKSLLLLLPIALAISSFGQNHRTERETDGFKSHVKTVSTESARLKNEAGHWVEDKRRMDSVVTYDVEGNRLKQDLYDYQGNLFQLSTYLMVDGDRAVKQEEIRYGYDPPLAATPGRKADAKPLTLDLTLSSSTNTTIRGVGQNRRGIATTARCGCAM